MRKSTLIALFVIFSLIAAFISTKTPPRGDELHYLLTAHSIVYDHDLAIGNNFAQKDYELWYQGPLDSHAVAGRDGQEYMYHGLGLFPVILSVPYAIGGRFGIHIALVFLFILLLDQIYKFCIDLKVNKKYALWTTLIFGFTVPLLNYSFVVFPEVFGGLVLLYSLRHKNSSLAGILPWIHLRFLPLAFILLFTRTRKRVVLSVLFILFYFVFYWFVFGTLNPSDTYAQVGIKTDTGNIAQNILLALVDPQYGLFFYSPIYLFGFAGLLKYKKHLILIAALYASYMIPVFRYHDWNGGYSPPARYLVPLLPLIIPMAALYLQKHKQTFIKIIFAIFVGWSTFASFVTLFLSHDYGFVPMNGYSEVLQRVWSITHINVFRFFPSFWGDYRVSEWHIVWFVVAVITTFILSRIENYKTK